MKKEHPPCTLFLVNLGTPEAPSRRGVGRFLRSFLGDRRVVSIRPRWAWKCLLNMVIVPLRSGRVARLYASIWDKKHKASPLFVHTRNLAQEVGKQMPSTVDVRYGMRHGTPSVPHVLQEIQKQKHSEHVLILPLFPQYSGTTTASVLDAVFHTFCAMEHRQPTLRIIPPFYAHHAYIDALVKSVKKAPKIKNIVVSFHGLPIENIKQGDPYQHHCQETFALLGKHLPDKKLWLSYQSRFGYARWLEPSTEEILKRLGHQKLSVLLLAPAFFCDCLETLEEIAIHHKILFQDCGGKDYHYVPCLNDSPQAVHLIKTLWEDNAPLLEHHKS